MKKYLLLLFALPIYSQPFNFQRTWATYYGNENLSLRDQAVDNEGNIYIVGSVLESDETITFTFATANAYQAQFGGGFYDGFIVKMAPAGDVIWASYFGGEDDDDVNAITIDKDDNIFILGATRSISGISTSGAFQPDSGGEGDNFIASFDVEGNIVWSTYYGGIANDAAPGGYADFDINFDDFDNLYFICGMQSEGLGSAGTFQPQKSGSRHMISKFTKGGQKIWSTYYGSNGSIQSGLAVNDTGIYVAGYINDSPPIYTPTTYFGTPGAHQPTEANTRDVFISKFSFDGNRLWGTYYGGALSENVARNCLVASGSLVYLAGGTTSTSGIATS